LQFLNFAISTITMSRPHVVAPSELSALRDLELVTRKTVEGLRHGLHRSPFHGYNAEFSQYRHYRPGDDLKYVDWKAFGRTDRLYSRQFRETTNLAALFVIDISRSMDYPAEGNSKFDLARSTAAILTALVIDQGDASGLLAVADPGGGAGTASTHYVAPRSGRHHLRVQLAALARLAPGGTEGAALALRQVPNLLRRRGLVVILSDFYEEEVVLTEVRRLARMGHDVVIVHVVAREELTLPRGGAVEFVDLESGRTLLASPNAIAAEYRAAFEALGSRVRQAIEREGLDYLRLVTREPLERALRRFLVGRRGER
jgi:uncharacterized protein (DUF58 family)